MVASFSSTVIVPLSLPLSHPLPLSPSLSRSLTLSFSLSLSLSLSPAGQRQRGVSPTLSSLLYNNTLGAPHLRSRSLWPEAGKEHWDGQARL